MNRRFALIAAVYLFAALDSFDSPTPRPHQPLRRLRPRRPNGCPPSRGKRRSSSSRAHRREVKGEVLTKMKVRNTSKGSIALLSVEEIWYNSKREIASNGIFRVKKLLQPGRNHRVHDQLAGEARPAARTC